MRKVKQLSQSAQLKAVGQRCTSVYWGLKAYPVEIEGHCYLGEIFRVGAWLVHVESPGKLAL